MATKSVLKTINIKEKATCRSLINALEHAENKSSQPVQFSRPVRVADHELAKKLFGENK